MWPVPASTTVAAADSSSTDSFSKDGRKIRVGDCALFKPPQDSPPFIGIIRKLALGKEDTLRLAVNWLYRPADIKLGKGSLLEAAPNEVFYSFHKDEIPAASLLHPCKVAFLRKGVELPSGISSFVCRRVYDIENKCLWWLTDKDYINERQEEVDKLLDKTRLEMHGVVQSGGRSPKPVNGPISTPQLKPGSESVQNSNSSFSSQAKGKKRERSDQGSDPVKRERISKTDEVEPGQLRPENVLRSEVAKITDKGGLVDFEGVEKLVKLMQLDSGEKKLDLVGRIMLVGVIAVTDKFECLERFVQLRGLPVLDEWLQEVHKGKIGEGSIPKENDKSVEEYLLALLRALDKLPVNLHALQTCNVGKSVNCLRSHKNSEIQKKSRSLVDMWKKRVGAEMNMIDAKSGPNRAVSWSSKPASSEVSHVGSRRSGASSEVGLKSSSVQPSASKSPMVKLGHVEAVSKFASGSPGSIKSSMTSVGINLKDPNSKTMVGAGISDPPLTPIKEEKSSSSSQSQNNSQSCSSDHAKAVASPLREDARSSTTGSLSVNKVSGGASRHRRSSNGTLGSASSGVQKEISLGKANPVNRSAYSDKESPTGVMNERVPDAPLVDNGNNQRLIVRLPNTGRSPARSVTGGSFEDPTAIFCKPSPSSPALSERHEHHDRKEKGKDEPMLVNTGSNLNSEFCQRKDDVAGTDECNVSPIDAAPHDGQCSAGNDGEKLMEVPNAVLSSRAELNSGKSFDASLSSINALIESCAKFSEASASASLGDDVGMNLLASVAAGEISKSDIVSPLGSPGRNSPPPQESCSGSETKFRQLDRDIAHSQGQNCDAANSGAISEQDDTVDSNQLKSGLQQPSLPTANFYGGSKSTFSGTEEKGGECIAKVNSSGGTEEGHTEGEGEGSNQPHEQKKISERAGSNVYDSTLNLKSPSVDGDKKVGHRDDNLLENGKVVELDSACRNAEIKVKANEAAPSSASDVVGELKNVVHNETSSNVSEQNPPFMEKSQVEFINGNGKDAALLSPSGIALNMESMAENARDVRVGGGNEQGEKSNKDLVSVLEQNVECDEEDSDGEVHGSHSGGSAPHAKLWGISRAISEHETEQCVKSSGNKLDRVGADGKDQRHASSVNASSSSAAGSDVPVKLDFDLNEGFPVDDGSQGQHVKLPVPGISSAVHLSCPIPFSISSMSGSFPASITVAAAAKGPFVPPENLLRSKGELGWKGSAATSAFRPAEPRKVLEMSFSATDSSPVDATTSRPGRPPLDIDLNIPGERILDDVASQNTAQVTCSEFRPRDPSAGIAGGLDFDLNRVEEGPDGGNFAVNSSFKFENPPLPSRSSLSGGFSNGGVNGSRDFDLNNGPGLDEVVTETASRSQHAKGNMSFLSPVPGIRMSNPESGSFSSWFPHGNSYSAITIPSIFPSRGDHTYPVTAAGSQRILGPPAGGASFSPEMYRGPVLSSSPAVAFPPASPFQYPGFPFETTFPLASSSFAGCSTAHMESSSGGALCYPAIPSQLVGPAGVVSSHYPRPYVMGLTGNTSGLGPESRKWGNQGLDLNAGPGSTDIERRDERLPPALRQISVVGSPALADEQLKMYQVAGGLLKRQEPDGGWESSDRLSYKQPSWQ